MRAPGTGLIDPPAAPPALKPPALWFRLPAEEAGLAGLENKLPPLAELVDVAAGEAGFVMLCDWRIALAALLPEIAELVAGIAGLGTSGLKRFAPFRASGENGTAGVTWPEAAVPGMSGLRGTLGLNREAPFNVSGENGMFAAAPPGVILPEATAGAAGPVRLVPGRAVGSVAAPPVALTPAAAVFEELAGPLCGFSALPGNVSCCICPPRVIDSESGRPF